MQKKIFNIRANIFFIFFCVLFCSIFAVIFPSSASAAANLSLIPASGSYIMGVNIPVSLTVDSGGVSINAAGLDLTFDNTKFNVSSIDTSASIFTTWTEYPAFSNFAGTIHFSGGIPHGFTGIGSILTINLKGIAQGTGNVDFVAGGKVLLNDGLGTNAIGTTTGGTYDILPVPMSVSCSASPSSTIINTPVTFSAAASGEVGPYTYVWTGACAGSNPTCTDSYSTTGTKTATVTATSSNSKTKTNTCSASVGLPGLNVSCSASPSSTAPNTQVTFSATASGGVGSYSYSWSNDCTGSSTTTCTNSYSTTGSKTATITVISGSQTSSSNCSVNIGLPGLNVSCSPSTQSIDANQPATFSATASGGSGIYTYSWSNDCTGSDQACTNSYSTPGLKTATVTVTSGGNSSSANCLLAVNAVCPAPVGLQHAICSSDGKCVSVFGAGQDVCQTDNDCKILITPPITPVTPTIITKVIEVPIKEVQVVTKTVYKAVNTPQGSAVTKTVSTTGAVVATAAAASSLFPFSFFELLLLPLRLFGLLMTALGLKKRVLSWGVAYDSVTKQPLDPAYVVLKNQQGKEVSSAITDLDGRFGFLVEPGVYQMQARKSNYNFPSQKLAGKAHDELYRDLYFGEDIIIKTSGEIIVKNIPLDPIKFDWNEFSKKNKNLMKFYSKWDIILRRIYDFFFAIGFIAAIVAYIFSPYPYNTVIIMLYVLFMLFRIFGVKSKTYGYIVDKMTGVPISFPIIRVITADSNREIASKSADRYGKYYCLVPPGKYYLNIEKKNEDGSYSLAYTSPVINVSHKGIIKQGFKI